MKILLSIFILCTTFVSYGQFSQPGGFIRINEYKPIDSAELKFTYRLLSVKNPAKPTETVEDIQSLQIGKIISKYYSQYFVNHSENIDQILKKGDRDVVERNPYKGSYAYEIFKHHPSSDKLTVTDLGDFPNVNYTYEENIPTINWTISPETTEVLGYRCQKATASFRGRDYTAWFTMQIPVNNGPWKFDGLPGLIMKITDSKNHYDWECIGIEQLKIKEPIKFYNMKFTKISREDMDKLFRRMHKDYASFLRASGVGKVIIVDDNGQPTATMSERPYNPIELE